MSQNEPNITTLRTELFRLRKTVEELEAHNNLLESTSAITNFLKNRLDTAIHPQNWSAVGKAALATTAVAATTSLAPTTSANSNIDDLSNLKLFSAPDRFYDSRIVNPDSRFPYTPSTDADRKFPSCASNAYNPNYIAPYMLECYLKLGNATGRAGQVIPSTANGVVGNLTLIAKRNTPGSLFFIFGSDFISSGTETAKKTGPVTSWSGVPNDAAYDGGLVMNSHFVSRLSKTSSAARVITNNNSGSNYSPITVGTGYLTLQFNEIGRVGTNINTNPYTPPASPYTYGFDFLIDIIGYFE